MTAKQPDANDLLRARGADAVRARHDGSRKYEPKANGRDDPQAAEKPAPADERATTSLISIMRDAGDNREPPPPRGWLLGNIFARRFVSSLIAEGGVGKTAVRTAQLLSLTTRKPLTGDHVFQRCRVLLICLEDDDDEMERRLTAAMLHFGIERSELKGWLFTLAPGAAAGKIMALDQHGRPIVGDLVEKLEQIIIEKQIDLVCLDPFVKTHSVPENDNGMIDQVVQVLTNLAVKYNIAVDTPHHTSKGPADPGNASRGRGASASKDAWRIVYSLAPMTEDEGRTFGISEHERRRLIRMDRAKVNIAPAIEAKWFKLVGVNIGNATDIYPNGDDVQTVSVWTPPDAFFGLDNLSLNQILNDIDAGMPDGNRYSNAPKAAIVPRRE